MGPGGKDHDLKTTFGSAFRLDEKNVKFFPIKNSLPYKDKEFFVLFNYLSNLSMRTSSPAVISQPASVLTAVAGWGSMSEGNTTISS
jgi:hypothetical protein